MNPNLFKSAEFYHRRYHNFSTLLILPLVALVLFLLLFSLFGKKEITLSTMGEITPTQVIAKIQSTSDNTVLTNNLEENKIIAQDNLLIQYSETMEAAQRTALETQRNIYQRQKAGLETLINSLKEGTNLFASQEDEFGYINTFNSFIRQSQDIALGISKANTEVTKQASIAENTVAAIDSQIATLMTQLAQYQELYTAISTNQSNLPTGNPHQATLASFHSQYNLTPDSSITNQYLSQINSNISSLESSIGSLNIQKASSASAATYDNSTSTKIEVLRTQFIQNASQQLTTISTQLTDTENHLVQADTLLENTQLLAPANGVIHLNTEFEGETLFPKGAEIAQIFPDITKTKEVLITFYVSSSEVTQLNKNQTARLSLEKIGNEPITITGTIQSIDTSATKTKQGNLFKATALAQVSTNDSKVLKYGTQGRVTCILATKTFFDYYKDKLCHQLA